MKRSIILYQGFSALLLASSSLASAEDLPECKLRETIPDRVTPLAGKPSYFAKVTSDGKYYAYIINSTNRLIDLDNPNTEAILPGSIDPVPVPPTGSDPKPHYITIPAAGMGFYSMDEIQKEMKIGETVKLRGLDHSFRDRNNTSNYQSIDVLSEGTPDGNGATYRVLAGSLKINDYDSSQRKWDVKNSKQICGKPGRYQLPMLSKDGKRVAVFDTEESVTKILSINSDGSCKEELNLGFPTGKVEFSYDGKAITFHSDTYSSAGNGREFSGAQSNMTKNVYTLELKETGGKLSAGKMKKLTNNTKKGTAAYYPSFTRDGRVVFIQGEKNANGGGTYSVHTVNPEPLPSSQNLHASGCNSPTELASVFALGALWTKICNEATGDQMTANDSAMWTLSLDPTACRELVNSKWASSKAAILADGKLTRSKKVTQGDLDQVTLESLQAACPPEDPATIAARPKPSATPTFVREQPPLPVLPPKETFSQLCSSCHAGSSSATKLNWDHLTLDQVNNMLIAIESGMMPLDSEISNREEALAPLVEELRKREINLRSKESKK